MSNKKNSKIILLNEAKHWFALLAMFTFASFSTGTTQAAWQISASISGNSLTTGEWASENSDETIVISTNTSAGENQPGWLFNRDTGTQSPYEFNDDVASIGTGALFVEPITNTVNGNSDKFIGELFLLEPLANFDGISYDFNIAQLTAADANQFYMNIYANFGESAPTKFYDCRYNVVPVSGLVGGWTTVNFDPSATYPVTTHGTSPHPCPASPSGMDGLSPGSTIRVIAINTGDTSGSDLGISGYFDKVVLSKTSSTITYDFEPVPVEPPAPAEIVLNEIFPAPVPPANQQTPPNDGEWIELYNAGETSADVLGWQVSEISGGGNGAEQFYTISSSCDAPASKKMIPFNGASTVVAPGGLLVLHFCTHANVLNNGGDTVALYDGSPTLVDSHTYPSTNNGKSHQRIPDGGVWVDPEPTPGEPNKVSRQDLIDSGLSEEQIDIIELMLLARGEYLIGEEPEQVAEEASLPVSGGGASAPTEEEVPEEVKEPEESEENLDEQSLNSTGSGGGSNAPAETENDEVIEDEVEEEVNEEDQDTQDSTLDSDSQGQTLDTENESVEVVEGVIESEPATEPESELEPVVEPEPIPEPADESLPVTEPEPAPEVISETTE